jgi:hypothetical protein
VFLRRLEALPDQINFTLRRLRPLLRFLLKAREDVDYTRKLDGINTTIRPTLVVFDNLKGARTAKSPERFSTPALAAGLRLYSGYAKSGMAHKIS